MGELCVDPDEGSVGTATSPEEGVLVGDVGLVVSGVTVGLLGVGEVCAVAPEVESVELLGVALLGEISEESDETEAARL
ncbi:hypothetical protein NIES2104_36670 [Leptolyngbya sp. NIES-2104]|nr:hypothetical protein NIES2104_36670 [Leptolyngbya sp. NIES-2104]